MTTNITCELLVSSISEYIEGELTDELCDDIRRHLSECDHCRVVLDTVNKTIYLYHTVDQRTEVPADMRERLYKKLNLEDYRKK